MAVEQACKQDQVPVAAAGVREGIGKWHGGGEIKNGDSCVCPLNSSSGKPWDTTEEGCTTLCCWEGRDSFDTF